MIRPNPFRPEHLMPNLKIFVVVCALCAVACDGGAKKKAEAQAAAAQKQLADAKKELEQKAQAEREAAEKALAQAKEALVAAQGQFTKQFEEASSSWDKSSKDLKTKAAKLPAKLKVKAKEQLAAFDAARATATSLKDQLLALQDPAASGELIAKANAALQSAKQALEDAQKTIAGKAKKK